MDRRACHEQRLEEPTQLLEKTRRDYKGVFLIPKLILCLDAVAALVDVPSSESRLNESQSPRSRNANSSVSSDTISVVWAFAWSINRRDSRLPNKLITIQAQQERQEEGSEEENQTDDSGSVHDRTQTTQQSTKSLTSENLEEAHAEQRRLNFLPSKKHGVPLRNIDLDSQSSELPSMPDCLEHICELQEIRKTIS